MHIRHALITMVAAASTATVSHAALFTEDFDVNNSANWTTNNNNNGVNKADYSFDYSTVGIPSAPHSTGGSTRGLKLGANVGGTAPTALSGISVSPTGQNFGSDYTLRFDWWHNWLGSTTTGISNAAGGSGSTQLSTFGVMTSGTVANYAGVSDAVSFAADGDGASAADFRIYSKEAQAGYGVGVTGNNAHVVYAAGSQNNTAALYGTVFPAGKTAPAAQTTLSSTQNGSTLAGTAGFAWHDVIIQKSGNIITWKVNGTLLATVNLTNFTAGTVPTGNNIFFGMADTSTGAGTPANLFEALDFTLIDNVQVLPEPGTLTLVAGAGLLARRRRK